MGREGSACDGYSEIFRVVPRQVCEVCYEHRLLSASNIGQWARVPTSASWLTWLRVQKLLVREVCGLSKRWHSGQVASSRHSAAALTVLKHNASQCEK